MSIEEQILAKLDEIGAAKAGKLATVNIKMTAANTQYRWQLPKGCKGFAMQCRDGTAVRVSTTEGVVAGSHPTYFTMKADSSFDDDDLNIQTVDQALYFACASANKVVEIVVRL